MNEKRERMLILGAARSGLALARLLLREGLTPALADEKLAAADLPADLASLPFYGGPFQAAWLDAVDTLVLSPGVSLASPAATAARERGLRLSGEMEEAWRRSATPILAVTGTNGKSTVTTLAGLLLEAGGLKAPAGGNLGRPYSELVLDEPAADLFVLEVSSFQCETFADFHPRLGALLNLSPDHLDRYAGAEDYYRAKLELFRNMTAADALVLPDDPDLDRRLAACPARRLRFSLTTAPPAGACLARGWLTLRRDGREQRVLPADELRLVGRHNLANALAALAMTLPYDLPPAALAEALRAFAGLPHRMEEVGRAGALFCFNDSKATNVAATLASLQGLDRSLLLIAGGRDKGGDFNALAAGLPQVRRAYGIGEAGAAVVRAFAARGVEAGDMERALALALSEGREEELLVLSPACSSFDQFRNFEERGDHFRRLVREAAS